ncbi:enolase C-terminal domain-like protein [Candidatus Latescibacterota bacterium]
MKRRDVMKNLVFGTAAGVSGILRDKNEAVAQTYSQATKGLPPLKITNVKAILTAPTSMSFMPYVIVKVETSEPGLYGIGCASYFFRPLAVVTLIDKYMDPLFRGKNANNIEDIWQQMYANTNTRNGPVLNSAMSGMDMALWDIKGKRTNMPVYELFGGKSRFAVDCYAHAGGRDFAELEEDVKRYMEEGYRHIRIEMRRYGEQNQIPHFKEAGFGADDDRYVDPAAYVVTIPRMFEYIRNKCGDKIELLHDMIYTRIQPIDSINMIKKLEPYRPFFIEDPFTVEDKGYLKLLRQRTGVPIALGEKFINPNTFVDLISERLIDFIRIHIPYIGGLTPARKIAAMGELHNVRTAWHGPRDNSPVGHAANAHLDLAIRNFGIQERVIFRQETLDVFPGTPTIKNGYMYVNEAPGLGIDINEKLAAKYPLAEDHFSWYTRTRYNDGTIRRP